MVKDLIVTVVIRKEQGKYTSWCPELDVASQGVSMEDARKNLQEAVELHVETMVENGDVQLLLEKMGFDEKDLKKSVLLSETFSGQLEIPVMLS